MPEPAFFFTANNTPPQEDCPVFLPGWGFDGRVTQLATSPRPWLTTGAFSSPEETEAALLDYLDRHNISSIVLAGWSLGAYLALDFALKHPGRVSALYLLAARHSWPAEEIAEIRSGLGDDPSSFLKSFYRKCFLGYRDSYRKFTYELEADYLKNFAPDILAEGLTFLENYPLADKLSRLAESSLPVYQVHGGQDIIAPVTERVEFKQGASLVIRTGGHPVFLEESCPLDWHRKKETLRRKFSRSATTYDNHATVQKEVAEKLLEMLPFSPPARILETGCGTGNYTRALNERYPEARITALDFADNMLAEAKRKLAGKATIDLVCTDAEEFLRNTGESFDLITSNATLHWFDNLEETARLISEHLTADGHLVCSTFGPGTMRELKDAFSDLHARKITMPSDYFPGQKGLQEILSPHFSHCGVSELQITRHYKTLADLLTHISKTGTGGWHPGAPLLSRQMLRDLEQWFTNKFGECCCSYQVFLVNCKKNDGKP